MSSFNAPIFFFFNTAKSLLSHERNALNHKELNTEAKVLQGNKILSLQSFDRNDTDL